MLKKDLVKNVVYISIILLIAIISTYNIYYKFHGDILIDDSSESLDIAYHDTNGDQIKITKVTPVTDSVGLSSTAYNLDIKNNLTIPVSYMIKIEDDLDAIREDECGESLIGHENIRISIKEGKKSNRIYSLDELMDGILLESSLDALNSTNIVIRTWVDFDTELTSGLDLHYHGKIVVVEEEV